MVLSEFELKRLEKLVGQYVEKRRPPPHIRPELDIVKLTSAGTCHG